MGDGPHAGPSAGRLALLGIFLVVESRFARSPLMPLYVFRRREVTVANVLVALLGFAMLPMWYFVTLYMQQVLRHSPIEAGLASGLVNTSPGFHLAFLIGAGAAAAGALVALTAAIPARARSSIRAPRVRAGPGRRPAPWPACRSRRPGPPLSAGT